jgi:hypothetical protein
VAQPACGAGCAHSVCAGHRTRGMSVPTLVPVTKMSAWCVRCEHFQPQEGWKFCTTACQLAHARVLKRVLHRLRRSGIGYRRVPLTRQMMVEALLSHQHPVNGGYFWVGMVEVRAPGCFAWLQGLGAGLVWAGKLLQYRCYVAADPVRGGVSLTLLCVDACAENHGGRGHGAVPSHPELQHHLATDVRARRTFEREGLLSRAAGGVQWRLQSRGSQAALIQPKEFSSAKASSTGCTCVRIIEDGCSIRPKYFASRED